MTDEQIKKALECCTTTLGCGDCPYEETDYACYKDMRLHRDALDLINRQQAEIEKLKGDKEYLKTCIGDIYEITKEMVGEE